MQDCRVSAHPIHAGTRSGTLLRVPASGRRVQTQEFAVYRFAASRIVHVWVTADNLHLLAQLR